MYVLSGNDADFDDSVIKISIVDDFNIVHRKMRIRSTSNTVAALIVAVSGLRKYAAVEDLRTNTFTYGQEVRPSQFAIQETTTVSYTHLTLPTNREV